MFKNSLKNSIYFLFFLTIGLIIFYYPTAITHFDKMPGDNGDAFLANYILEHFWLWLHQIPQHQSFWDMPFYYPKLNTLAYSDIMLGGMIIYAPIRFFFKNPLTTMQVWVGVICFINYLTFWFLLRKNLKFNALSASIGAFIFAFSVMRYFKMIHLTYYIQYPMIIALICLLTVNKNNKVWQNHLSFAGFAGFIALEFYSSYTLGWFFCFTAVVALIFSLLFKTSRIYLTNFIKTYYNEIIIYTFGFIILLFPLMHHYLMLHVVRDFNEVQFFLIDPTLWIRNISRLDNLIFFQPIKNVESYGGIGFITMIAAFIGIFNLKKGKTVILTTMFTLMILCCKFGDFSLWKYIYHIPGACGMRVVSRSCFILLMFYSFGIACFIQILHTIKNKFLSIFLILFTISVILIEQIPLNNFTYKWSKQETTNIINEAVSNLPNDCEVLYVENQKEKYNINLLTMWVATKKNIYSANGYSGILLKGVYNYSPVNYCTYDFEK